MTVISPPSVFELDEGTAVVADDDAAAVGARVEMMFPPPCAADRGVHWLGQKASMQTVVS